MSQVRNVKKVGDKLRIKDYKLHKKWDQKKANGVRLEGEKSSLCRELHATKSQWQRQKTLKKTFINRGKETQRELESLQKYSDPETLGAAKIAAQVRSSIKQKKKKDLQKDYEQLQVAFTMFQEKFTAELQAEKDKNNFLQSELHRISALPQEVNMRYEPDAAALEKKVEDLQQKLERETEQKNVILTYYEELQAALSQDRLSAELQVEKNKLLQKELERITVSHDEISRKYETDVVTVRQQAESLQWQLDKEVQHHAATVAEGWTVINGLKAELEALHQKMAEEMRVQQQQATKKEGLLKQELEDLKTQLDKQLSQNLEISKKLKAEQEEYRPPCKRARRMEEHVDELHQLHQLPPNTPSIQPLTSYWKNPNVQESITMEGGVEETPEIKKTKKS